MEKIYAELSTINKVFDIFTYFEHKDLLFMQFHLGVGNQTIIYNQKTKDINKVANMFFDDLIYKENNELFYSPQIVTQDDNGIYIKFGDNEMNTLKKGLEKNLVNENFKAAIDLLNLEKDANPILLYYEFKD